VCIFPDCCLRQLVHRRRPSVGRYLTGTLLFYQDVLAHTATFPRQEYITIDHLMDANWVAAHRRGLVKYKMDSLEAANASTGNDRSARALEWMGLLPALGACAWVILNFG
jgi:hypothetical protein